MPETIGGIPLHPLVVHGAVVLVPLAAVGVILIAFAPRWRERYGGLIALVSLAALVSTQVAKMSGEDFKESFGPTDRIETHQGLGEKLLYFVIPLFLVAVALWWEGRRERQREPFSKGLTATLGVVSVVVALAAGAWVVRVGHSGANAAWGGVVTEDSSGEGGG